MAELIRANRVTISTTEQGYEAKFYRTHKVIDTILSADTDWQADENANATTNRESYRAWICDNADGYGILWSPDKAEQAWERKHNTYLEDWQVAEDVTTLVTPALERLAGKCRYNMEIEEIRISDIAPKSSNLSYVEDGKYMKSGAWCVAGIEVTVTANIDGGHIVDIIYEMEMKSGQICKPKTTIAQWNEIVARELELHGIVLESEEEVQVA